MRTAIACGLFLMAIAGSAAAQVQVDARLEKTQYLAGEPIVLFVEVRNVGDEAVAYSAGFGNVGMTVAGVPKRIRPDIFGCTHGVGSGIALGVASHPPLLQPGQRTSFTYVLKEYDLKPGEYDLAAAGTAGVQRNVAGADFARTLRFSVVAATDNELRAVLAPMLADADGSDATKRHVARQALIESAPPFLVSVIARFAADEPYQVLAVDALGRMATPGSRAHLKNLFRTGSARRDSEILLALAGIGHRDDADFLAGALHDPAVAERTRTNAAFGLGWLGGERAVRELERALPSASEQLLVSIVTALGNTRSRDAIPVLIGMWGNNPARNAVCGAMKTLTHQVWCDGTDTDPAAVRRQWLRRWNEEGARSPMFGPDNCRPLRPLPASRPRLLALARHLPVRALVRHPPVRQPSWRRTPGSHRGTRSSVYRATTSDSKTENLFA